MNFAGLRPIGSAVLLVLLAGAGCNRPERASLESTTPSTPQEVRVSVTAHAPDAFYDSPSDSSRKPGALLRSEPLKDVTLPAGVEAGVSFVRPLWTTTRQRWRSQQCLRQPILPLAHVLSSHGTMLRRACCRNACPRFCRRQPKASPGATRS